MNKSRDQERSHVTPGSTAPEVVSFCHRIENEFNWGLERAYWTLSAGMLLPLKVLREVYKEAFNKASFILGPWDIYLARISRETTMGMWDQVRFRVMIFLQSFFFCHFGGIQQVTNIPAGV